MAGKHKSPALDPGAFAEQLLGEPLWPHQQALAESPARYRVVLAGRQVGKSRLLAVLALHQAFTVAGSRTLIVSTGEVASQRLLEDCKALAVGSELLRGSVISESKSELILTNGSRILSVPASMRQIRGWTVDLLVIDEACFVADEVWRASEPTIAARRGSRVVLASTPWGEAEHYFRRLYSEGLAGSSGMVDSFHWPSELSPLVDRELLEHWQATTPEREFRREYLAEFVEESGQYFTTSEVHAAVEPELGSVELAKAKDLGPVVGGIDFGWRRDAHALVVIRETGQTEYGEPILAVEYVEERYQMPYQAWVERIEELTAGAGKEPKSGFWWSRLNAESNGVGAMPSQVLASRLEAAGWSRVVVPFATTARTKEDAFGYAKVLLGSGRLRLPQHPPLLRQLTALEFENLPGGGSRIAVPEVRGHDDVVMAFALALAATEPGKKRHDFIAIGLD